MSDKRSRSRSGKRRVTFSGGSYKPTGSYYQTERATVSEIVRERNSSSEEPYKKMIWIVLALMVALFVIKYNDDGKHLKGSEDHNERVVKERQHAVSS